MGQYKPPPYPYPQPSNQCPPPYSPGNPHVVTQQPVPYNIGNSQPVQPCAPDSTVSPSAPVVQVPVVGIKSLDMTCPTCNSRILTEVDTKASKHAQRMSIVLCLLGCWLCCCCVPYCMDTCMDADHRCPNCKNIIGTYKC